MTIAFVQKTKGADAQFSTVITTSFSSSVTAGNLLVAIFYGYTGSGDTITVTDNKSNTWSSAAILDDGANSGGWIGIFYTIATTGGSSFDVSLNDGNAFFGSLDIAEFSGISGTPLDVHITTNQPLSGGETSVSSSATGSLAQASELIIAALNFIDGSTSITAATPSGYTDLFQRLDPIAEGITSDAAYLIVNSTSTQTATWSLSGYTATSSDYNLDFIVSFKAAGGTNISMSAASNAYSWSVTAATFAHGFSAASKSYSWGATAATFAHSLVAATKAYTWNVTAATFAHGFNAISRSYTISGAATFARSLVVATRAYTWSATAATFAIAMSAASKSYTWSATAVTFAKVLSMAAASRAYIWSAQAVTLVVTTANIVRNNALKLGISIGNKMGLSI